MRRTSSQVSSTDTYFPSVKFTWHLTFLENVVPPGSGLRKLVISLAFTPIPTPEALCSRMKITHAIIQLASKYWLQRRSESKSDQAEQWEPIQIPKLQRKNRHRDLR